MKKNKKKIRKREESRKISLHKMEREGKREKKVIEGERKAGKERTEESCEKSKG